MSNTQETKQLKLPLPSKIEVEFKWIFDIIKKYAR